jgi:hypothetical protein
VARSFELSLGNTPTKIESITRPSPFCLDIANISIQPKDQEPLQIEHILLNIRFFDLFSWFNLPVRSPLIIEKATVSFQTLPPLLLFTQTSPDLIIDEIEVITPDGQKHLFSEEKGSIGSILMDVLDTISSEKSPHA